MAIDITFNMYSDTPKGKDPDAYSPTLRRYHKQLWSRKLPNGRDLNLSDAKPGSYLYHNSGLGEFFLSSDAITHSYKTTKSISHVIAELPSDQVDSLFNKGSTIGAYIIFPAKKIDGKMTINGARGLSRQIKDRFDLTLECIRLHYVGLSNPLEDVLLRYRDFFNLFTDFRGYVDYFLLQDLVSGDYNEVKFYLPFDDFKNSPLPDTRDRYLRYRENTIAFIDARNHRILSASN